MRNVPIGSGAFCKNVSPDADAVWGDLESSALLKEWGRFGGFIASPRF